MEASDVSSTHKPAAVLFTSKEEVTRVASEVGKYVEDAYEWPEAWGSAIFNIILSFRSSHHLQGIVTYELESTYDDRWGVYWDWKTFRVYSVKEGDQFWRVGIREGWRLLERKDEGEEMRSVTQWDQHNIGRKKCTLRFNVDRLKMGDDVMLCGLPVKHEKYEGLTGFLLEELVGKQKWRMYSYSMNREFEVHITVIVKKDLGGKEFGVNKKLILDREEKRQRKAREEERERERRRRQEAQEALEEHMSIVASYRASERHRESENQ